MKTPILTSEPSTAPDARLDSVILACATGEWMKVAILIARTTDAARTAALDAPAQIIAARIYALVDERRLQVKGNVRRWRAGEVRIAPI